MNKKAHPMIPDPPRAKSSRRLDRRPLYALSFFTFCWLIGIATGEPGQVLALAIRICLSCIGIG